MSPESLWVEIVMITIALCGFAGLGVLIAEARHKAAKSKYPEKPDGSDGWFIG